MYTPSIHSLIGKKVRVVADGLVYKGVLIEVSEDTVDLQGETQWITIPVEKINSITEEG